jgi:hypothetical protein
MIPCGQIISRLQNLVDDESDETKVIIRRHLNNVYYGMAMERNWLDLRKVLTIPSSLVLPSDCLRIYYAQPEDTDYQFYQSGISKRYTDNRFLYNWFISLPTTTPLLIGDDLITAINSTAISSVTGGFTEAMVGEYLRVGAEPGFYKIKTYTDTNNVILDQQFRSANLENPSSPAALTAQYFEVRPNGTKQIVMHDELGDAITTGSHKLWYTSTPLPMYNDYDQIMLPGSCEAVFLAVAKIMDRSDRYSNDALKLQQDYEDEFDRMKALDWIPSRKARPRDALGHQIRFGRLKGEGRRVDSNERRIL